MSQIEQVANILKNNEGKKLSALEIANLLLENYWEDTYKFRLKDYHGDRDKLLKQVRGEIYPLQKSMHKYNIKWLENVKPRTYYYECDENINKISTNIEFYDTKDNDNYINERSLYDKFIEYLKIDFNLYAKRIDETKARKDIVKNKWFYPDIVALEPLLEDWDQETKECFKSSFRQSARLWSFELKYELSSDNVRESYFQSVSNSTWANEGYLVSRYIDNNAIEELRALCSLHGIGVISFDPNDLSQSEILIPSKHREINWKSIDKLITKNSDFRDFIINVNIYLSQGYLKF